MGSWSARARARSRWLGLVVSSAVVALAAVSLACGPQSGAPSYRKLARGFRPQPLEAAAGPRSTVEPAATGGGLWVVSRIRADAWSPARGGLWRAPRGIPGNGRPKDGSAGQRLETVAGAYDAVSHKRVAAEPELIRPMSFSVIGRSVWACPPDPDRPPGDAVLSEYVERGSERDGAWRVKVGRYEAEGFLVPPGFAEDLDCELPPGSALRFATTARGGSEAADATHAVTFSVSLDGEPLWKRDLAIGFRARTSRHVVALPPEGRARARLTFAVEGSPALAAFHVPVIGPLDAAAAARPPRALRPDIVVFMADTFRADNMALYGGDPAFTPHLDRFARESVRFRRAWSSSNWTLPTHAALFSGLYPTQTGVGRESAGLSPEADTIAERLSAAGYRTGAVTDGMFVTSAHGLSQGFGWFDEAHLDFEDTLEGVRRFLDADDGRPIFLFVHTYLTHGPYRATAEARRRLGLEAAHREVERSAGTACQGLPSDSPPPPDVARACQALYRGGAADLDAGFERLRADLEERGILERGVLVFTSDHGEGFWEHGIGGHSIGLWEEMTRVPLLIGGGGLEPRDVSFSATSVDFPRTLAALAGVAPSPSWQGEDLLALERDRPALLFECTIREDATLAVVTGDRKVVASARRPASEPRNVLFVHDLASDPGERIRLADLLPAALRLESMAPWLDELLVPVLPAEVADLDLEQRAALRALGYAGE
jgi:arylsulfatase A-like enzyme